MLLTRLLNACHHFPGFVYGTARLCTHSNTIEIEVRARKGSRACCSGCHKPARGYDQLPQRRFEFIPIWGFAVFLLYSMRRVECRRCGVKVEEVPWATGKHQLTRAYMLYLAHWARKLSWKETAQSFHTSWEKVQQAVAYVVQWGLEHRELGHIRAIGVDEIAYGRGHEYLTLVYQIEAGCTRLLWVGEKRTKEAFQKFFDLIGVELAQKIEFVCSDMWKPYLDMIKLHCTGALNILDRFHIVAKLNLAIDEVRAGEARQLVRDGYAPVLKKSRWCLLKRPVNLTGKFLDQWCNEVMRSRIDPLKKFARTVRSHRELLLNYFRARKAFSSGIVEGLNNKAKVTMRKAYGYRTFKMSELSLYHVLGKLPEPELGHKFY
jgi:transposase